jgi:hygromycin-B 7''-O-kinase
MNFLNGFVLISFLFTYANDLPINFHPFNSHESIMTNQNPILTFPNTWDEYETIKSNHNMIKKAIHHIMDNHNLNLEPLNFFTEGTNVVCGCGDDLIIKLFPPMNRQDCVREILVLNHLNNKLSVHTPTLMGDGEIDGWPYFIMNRIDGTLLDTLWDDMDHSNKIIIIKELGALIQEVHSLPTHGLESIDCHWEQFIDDQIKNCFHLHQNNTLSPNLVRDIDNYVNSIKDSLINIDNPVLLTGEYTPVNLIVKQIEGIWHIHGLIDFGDTMLGRFDYDLLGPVAFLIQGNKELLIEFLMSYGYLKNDLNSNLSHQLMALMLLHRYSHLDRQIKIKDWKKNVHTINDLEKLVWGFNDN